MENVRKDGDIKLVTKEKRRNYLMLVFKKKKKKKKKKIMAIETLINQ